MPKITDLPQGVLDIIFGHLKSKSLRSASLTTPSWSQVYKRRCCKTLRCKLSSSTPQDRSALLERWQKLGLLENIHQIIIIDDSENGHDADEALRNLLDEWLPELTGLKVFTADLSNNPKPTNPTWLSRLPPETYLDLVCEGGLPADVLANVLSAAQAHGGLRSLALDFRREDELLLGGLLKDVLMSCKDLTALRVNVSSVPAESQAEDTQHQSPDEPSLSLTAADARRIPALRSLDLYYPPLTASAFQVWAEHGDWNNLRSLVAHHDWVLDPLKGRLPMLESLEVRTLDSLPSFLDKQHGLPGLAVTNLNMRSEAGEATSRLLDVLKHPVVASLHDLELRMTKVDESEPLKVDVGTIAMCCPELRQLTIALDREQYINAVGYFCWLDACIEAVLRMPRLLRLCIVLPRLILSGSISIPPESIVMGTSSEIRSKLASHGKLMQEVRVVALMNEEVAQSERETAVLQYMSSENYALTFIATPAEKDWDAERGTQQTSCPELERAEVLLVKGYTSHLHPSGDYSRARRTIDDISALAYNGMFMPKKKIRPMPVWLTPEEEQDRREGPPSAARKAKRATIKSMNHFFGTWNPMMNETTPRTAAEKAASRESGFGGRPGWSKSSFATRVLWRR